MCTPIHSLRFARNALVQSVDKIKLITISYSHTRRQPDPVRCMTNPATNLRKPSQVLPDFSVRYVAMWLC
jgi:hypothetical protein